MRYRKLDADGDMTFGRGLDDFYIDVPEAPAQAVMTRLRLYEGEWFLDTSDGTAWNSRVLGRYTGSTYDPEIQARILGTPQVTAMPAYASALDPASRRLTVRATIDTSYGRTQIVEPI